MKFDCDYFPYDFHRMKKLGYYSKLDQEQAKSAYLNAKICKLSLVLRHLHEGVMEKLSELEVLKQATGADVTGFEASFRALHEAFCNLPLEKGEVVQQVKGEESTPSWPPEWPCPSETSDAPAGGEPSAPDAPDEVPDAREARAVQDC